MHTLAAKPYAVYLVSSARLRRIIVGASILTNKPRDQLIDETRGAAIALYEDFQVLKDVCAKVDTNPVDLRQASAILRRLIVEGELARVSSPRVNRLHLEAVDNNPIYRAERSGGLVSFVSGGAVIHGVYMAAGMVNEQGRPLKIEGYHPDTLEAFRLKTFAEQRVVYSQGEWFTRQQVIKFVANADHGVHGHGARQDWEKRLLNFRLELSVSLVEGPDGKHMPAITWQDGKNAGEIIAEKYDPSRVNGVLLELLATMHFLVQSPEMIALVDVIKQEIS